MNKLLKRLIKRTYWHNLRRIHPLSKIFGFDRGTPIDRYYIERFLQTNKSLIRGIVLEVSEDHYSKKLGTDIIKQEVIDHDKNNPKATIIADLTQPSTLPQSQIDCFICTQTLNFIYDFKKAVEGIHYVLRKDGVTLTTIAGLCQISRYDMERWGDYWRFTDLSIKKIFTEVFGENNVEVQTYGNVLTAVSLLEGIASEELESKELDFHDPNYQILITVKATKK